MRSLALVLLCTVLLPVGSCGSEPEQASDASTADGAQVVGLRVHLTFGFESAANTPWWSDSRNALRLQTTGSALEHYDFDSTSLDTQYQAVVTLPYPAGAQAGPATVSFYAIHGTGNWEGSTTFTADPAATADVDLFVPYRSLGDAGP
jgi:hypothetical protein